MTQEGITYVAAAIIVLTAGSILWIRSFKRLYEDPRGTKSQRGKHVLLLFIQATITIEVVFLILYSSVGWFEWRMVAVSMVVSLLTGALLTLGGILQAAGARLLRRWVISLADRAPDRVRRRLRADRRLRIHRNDQGGRVRGRRSDHDVSGRR